MIPSLFPFFKHCARIRVNVKIHFDYTLNVEASLLAAPSFGIFKCVSFVGLTWFQRECICVYSVSIIRGERNRVLKFITSDSCFSVFTAAVFR